MRSGKEGLEILQLLQLLETRVGYSGEMDECGSDGCDRLEHHGLDRRRRTSNVVENRSRV